ncbi:hydroxymethylglutaryl-CoA lyase, mitochondrial [Tribolium castaneum]|uniref:hydroxymethylglutaryl-CoA lyase n=1 Tax=Tribolium castaneum TaxID=7070 RepID=D6W7Q3_TRICA|nr:PREDICTED: hydroxymethylglutaryl-CoA lyase, mitochondrial [Tribolium castaneum]EFA11247.2 3-hydroxymethyl-3-methylglutaryl-CoA lyase, cytoplasmic-like Protein [Tribolium castaneum]|eukprot:XP_008199425.1 PREDICTED: hydroxymethylglutaryl-CoA lyase, mitochondrial [Tribolium castaneum]
MFANTVRSLLPRRAQSHFKRNLHKPFVKIVEVGPRDGLQNEPTHVPTDVKIEFINKLSETGLQSIEVTSFVSPKWVPQMGDNTEVFTKIAKKPSISYPVLVPNVKGLEAAVSVGAKEIAVFASASEGFSRKNTNCSTQEGVNRIKEIVEKTKSLDSTLRIRGYISCVVGCPYDGYIQPKAVTTICESLLSLGCYEISLGDTIGVGTRSTMEKMIKDLLKITSADKLAIHCHDTYGQALVNICTALDLGIRVVDSSVSGLGGCPYAAGATGNVASEDLVYMLHGMGAETGVDLKKLISAGHFISEKIKKPTASRVNKAMYKKYFQ